MLAGTDTAALQVFVTNSHCLYEPFKIYLQGLIIKISKSTIERYGLSEAIALPAIENTYMYLPIAGKGGSNLEARERVAYASTMTVITMQLKSTAAQHAMEHTMRAYHRNVQHGAGLIMITVAFAQFFID